MAEEAPDYKQKRKKQGKYLFILKVNDYQIKWYPRSNIRISFYNFLFKKTTCHYVTYNFIKRCSNSKLQNKLSLFPSSKTGTTEIEFVTFIY